MTIWKEPGRGRKPCPSCSVFIGVRCKFCECGHDFGMKTKPRVAKSESATPKKFVHLVAPAGECPVELSGSDEEHVLKWMKAVTRWWRRRHQTLAESAFRLYVSQFYARETPEYGVVLCHVSANYKAPPIEVPSHGLH